ncbi:hypothetical protein FNF31_04114 [Cafeteria roenbergensis]|uniref:DUF455 domain-containing protein n=1 Tax=Cafeteria roenbergensis TaxID=33653 RepID=A0A5A8D8U4_CAFRO|nr:hypothetical protein FNF31_04114 [Cafeteria roenbergensis]KAA0164783.1 hypothetical protein FNF28_03670 [Cafeteria roenbergensis]
MAATAAKSRAEPAMAFNADEEATVPAVPGSLIEAAVAVLNTAGGFAKAALTERAVEAWRAGSLPLLPDAGKEVPMPPAEPARPSYVELLPPGKVSNKSRLAGIHALVHAESCAIDLSWDIIARFGVRRGAGAGEPAAAAMPPAFFEDWVRVAAEEADHFRSWHARLEEWGGAYGCIPAHSSLWSSAMETADSLAARLAIIHCVHEARGLDVYPLARRKLDGAGDKLSVALLDRNARMEVDHVGAGVRWLKRIAETGRDVAGGTGLEQALPAKWEAAVEAAAAEAVSEAAAADAAATDACPAADADAGVAARARATALFHSITADRFTGRLRPPFNTEWRDLAGMPREWYEPAERKAE